MDEKVRKIYDFVQHFEDLYYSKLTGGKNINSDMIMSASATAFQKVRYFIEEMIEHDENKL